MVKMLMTDGRLKLAADGVFADGNVDEQLDVPRRAWPTRRDRVDLDEDSIWFLSDASFGLVWISPVGNDDYHLGFPEQPGIAAVEGSWLQVKMGDNTHLVGAALGRAADPSINLFSTRGDR